MPLPKQLRLTSNGKTINTREPLPLHGQPRILAVKTNSTHELTSSKLPTLVNERQTQHSQATNQLTVWPQLLRLLALSFAPSLSQVIDRCSSDKLGRVRVND